MDFLNNLTLVHKFFSVLVRNISLSNCVKCFFTSSRSACPSDSSFIGTEPIARVDSIKYLGITVDKNLRWSSRIYVYATKVRRLICRLDRTPSYLSANISRLPPYFRLPLLVVRWGNDFRTLCRLSVVYLSHHWKSSAPNCVAYIDPRMENWSRNSFRVCPILCATVLFLNAVPTPGNTLPFDPCPRAQL